MGEEMKNYVKIIPKVLDNTLEDFLAVIGLSWGLVQNRSGTELTVPYPVDLGIERRRKCCRISNILVIRCSVVPAHRREDKFEAKEEERQLFISQHVKRMYSCFWKWLCPSITELPWSESFGETRCIRSDATRNYCTICSRRNASQWRATGKPVAKFTSEDLKIHQQTRNYPNCALKHVWIWSKLDNSSMLFHHRKNRRSDLYAENMHYLETKRKIVQKDGSEATNDSALSWR